MKLKNIYLIPLISSALSQASPIAQLLQFCADARDGSVRKLVEARLKINRGQQYLVTNSRNGNICAACGATGIAGVGISQCISEECTSVSPEFCLCVSALCSVACICVSSALNNQHGAQNPRT